MALENVPKRIRALNKDVRLGAQVHQVSDVLCPIGLQFEMMIGQQACNQDTSKSVYKSIDEELIN